MGRAVIAFGATALATVIASNCPAQVPQNKPSTTAPAGHQNARIEDWGNADDGDLQEVISHTMRPFAGVSHPAVDISTLNGKVMCGYQGWFTAPGDGSEKGWTHWRGRDGFRPGSSVIEFWPDVTELSSDERFETPFRHADGSSAQVFSAFNDKTVLRHFQWMKNYGIDGVFVQRFVVDISTPKGLRSVNVVLDHCREGANLYGRTYAVMYDLSGMSGGEMHRVIDDWKLLVDRMQITKEDPAYLHHAGKPVVAVCRGFGFSDGRKYTPEEGLELVQFLKNDPHYGGCTVMLGVPAYWRTLTRDAVSDETLHDLILKADIVSPWTVGRYTNPEDAANYAPEHRETRHRLVQRTRKRVSARGVPRFQLAQHEPALALRPNTAFAGEIPLETIR